MRSLDLMITLIAALMLIPLSLSICVKGSDSDPSVGNGFSIKDPGVYSLIEWDGEIEKLHLTITKEGEDDAVNIIPLKTIPNIYSGDMEAFDKFKFAFDGYGSNYLQDLLGPYPEVNPYEDGDPISTGSWTYGDHHLKLVDLKESTDQMNDIERILNEMGMVDSITDTNTAVLISEYIESGYSYYLIDMIDTSDDPISDPLLIEWRTDRIELPLRLTFELTKIENLTCAILSKDNILMNYTGPYFDRHYPKRCIVGHISEAEMLSKVGTGGPLDPIGYNVYFMETDFSADYPIEDIILDDYSGGYKMMSTDRMSYVWAQDGSEIGYYLMTDISGRIVKRMRLVDSDGGNILWETVDLPENRTSRDHTRVWSFCGEKDPYILVYTEFDEDGWDTCSIRRYSVDNGNILWETFYGSDLRVYSMSNTIRSPDGDEHIYMYSRKYRTGLLLNLENGDFTKISQDAEGHQPGEDHECQSKLDRSDHDVVLLVDPYLCIWDPWEGENGSMKYVENVPDPVYDLDVLGTFQHDGEQYVYLDMDERIMIYDDTLQKVIDKPMPEWTQFHGYFGDHPDNGNPLGLIYSRYDARKGVIVMDLLTGETVFSRDFKGYTNTGYYIDVYLKNIGDGKWGLIVSNWQKDPKVRTFSFYSKAARWNYTAQYEEDVSMVYFFDLFEGTSLWSHEGRVIFTGDILDRDGEEVMIQNDEDYLIVGQINGEILKTIPRPDLLGDGERAVLRNMDQDQTTEVVISDNLGHIIVVDPDAEKSWLMDTNLPGSYIIGEATDATSSNLMVSTHDSIIWYNLHGQEKEIEEKEIPLGLSTVFLAILIACILSILIGKGPGRRPERQSLFFG